MLDLARNITYSNRAVLKGDWKTFNQTPYLGTDVYNKKLAIIGLGQIATAFSRRAIHGFNMDVSYWSRTRKIKIENELGVYMAQRLEQRSKIGAQYLIYLCLTKPQFKRALVINDFTTKK